ncbi:uncharacterized protein LOC135100997 [Scylla paramamosain]|uniref:uncharacterized protein LOC135100997 n=1 Tax=Scylla paramamosain TaxID=85552 RepID=UPI003082B002
MRWWRPVPVSVLVVVLLVLIFISWGLFLFFYENWTASFFSLTRILSAADTDVHPSDTHPHAFNIHPHITNILSHTINITATDIAPRNNQANTADIPTNSTNTQAYGSPNTTTTTTTTTTTFPSSRVPQGAPSDAASDEECAEQYQGEGPMRRVVLWTPFWHSWDGWKGMIRDHGALREGRCATWRCEFLWGPNVTTAQVQEADAVMFFSLDVLMRPLPPRLPHALWIWLELEAPIISQMATPLWNQLESVGVFFNLTMSYHHLNPITALAGELVPLSTPQHCPISSTFYLDTSSPTYTSYSHHMHKFSHWLRENGVAVDGRLRNERDRRHGGLIHQPDDNTTLTEPLPEDYNEEGQGNETSLMEDNDFTLTAEEIALATRPRVAAWMASHCHTDSRREDLVTALQGFIAITTVGKCGELKCGENHMDDYCFRWLSASHLFYLSFENALCDDYHTEKLWIPLKYGMVPVVYGGPSYRHTLPFNSYIDVLKFPSAAALANHLLYLATHPAAYLRHLQWRRYWRVRRVLPWCDLCATLHRQTDPVRTTLTQWWTNTATCYEPPPWKQY